MFDAGFEWHAAFFFHGTAAEEGLATALACPVVNDELTIDEELQMTMFSEITAT